jgi:uncharacterized damage-inducible protein DinB
MALEKQIRDLLIEDIRKRIIQESIPRIILCLGRLTDDQVWRKPNNNSNSIGNLVLHLNGNVRQWILSGIFREKDDRDRDYEFSFKGPSPKKSLVELLENLAKDTKVALNQITAEMLVEARTVQGFEETVLSILIHVTEHFSYHTGQIAFYTKILRDEDLGFYADFDLNIKSD